MIYRPEIDGLRAFAVLPVLLFHAGSQIFSGGYVGVDVFFVISGYLITGILIDEASSQNFSILKFYERRARRLLPALFVVVIVCVPFAWLWMLPGQLKDFSQSMVATSLFASNFLFWHESGYFDSAAELKPLLHTWSLAVEEQYYILFPLAVVALWPRSRKIFICLLVLLSLASFTASELLLRNNPSASFYSPLSRAWELLAGSLAAIFIRKRGIHGNNLLSLCGLALVLFSIFSFDAQTPFPGKNALIPVVGTFLIILFTNPKTLVWKLLTFRPLVLVGLLSYSLYLWHQPIFAFAQLKGINKEEATLFLCTTSLFIGYISWKYIETPFRNRQQITTKTIAALSISGLILMGLIGIIGWKSAFTIHPKAALYNATDRDMYKTLKEEKCKQWHSVKYSTIEPKTVQQCTNKTTLPTFFLLGDSHALNLHNIFVDTGLPLNLFSFATGGCRYTDQRYDHCGQLFQDFNSIIKMAGPTDTIIYHQAGSQFISNPKGEYAPYDYNKFSHSEGTILSDKVRYVFHQLVEIQKNTKAKVIWIGPWIENRDQNLNNFNKNSVVYFDRLERQIKQISVEYPVVNYVAFNYLIGQNMSDLDIASEGCLVYQDANHFSACGEKRISNFILENENQNILKVTSDNQ